MHQSFARRFEDIVFRLKYQLEIGTVSNNTSNVILAFISRVLFELLFETSYSNYISWRQSIRSLLAFSPFNREKIFFKSLLYLMVLDLPLVFIGGGIIKKKSKYLHQGLLDSGNMLPGAYVIQVSIIINIFHCDEDSEFN
eukprot:snap_masked-scaffold_5-processed-gene-10.39-mRNA-1 protein AED:1.00 eAED:1.00 QI:0/0/0/0/1/1/3/0/139